MMAYPCHVLRLRRRVSSILFMSLLLVGVPGAWSAVYYVDSARPDDTGAGTSWAAAKKTIQPAIDLAAAAGGGQVWVKGGTYGEARRASDGALVLKSKIELYGGFAGVETALGQRNVTLNPTIIDGAVARAGQPAYHVVVLDSISTARLDGFTIRNGEGAPDYSVNSEGAGIFCNNLPTTSTIINCLVTGCSAQYGAGLYCQNSPVLLAQSTITGNAGTGLYIASGKAIRAVGCTISQNTAHGVSAYGGSLSQPTMISDCLISGNTSNRGFGGGIDITAPTELYNCLIEKNTHPSFGGGMYATGTSVKVTSCTFSANDSGWGGAVYIDANDSLIRNCRFTGNSGGCLYYDHLPTFKVDSCIFENNAKSGAIIIYSLFGNTASITNCVINNTTNGTIYNSYGIELYYASPVITNCLIRGTRTGGPGASYGVYCYVSSSPRITNTIFYDNGDYGIAENSSDSNPLVRNCLFYGHTKGDYLNNNGTGWDVLKTADMVNILLSGSGAQNSGNLDGDPKLTGLYQFGAGSAALDRGLPVSDPAYDIDGIPRPIDFPGVGIDGVGLGTDIGPYEYGAAAVGKLVSSPSTLQFLDGTIWSVDVEKGEQPKVQSLTLTNTGDKALVFTGGDAGTLGLARGGPCAADFRIDRVSPATNTPLAPGASLTVDIRFAPTMSTRTLGLDATLTVTTDSPLTPTVNIPLLGDAVPVEISGFSVE